MRVKFVKPKPWEWLVAIGICFCLAGIFFPVIACACKKASPRTACHSNLKQLSLALHMYKADHDDSLPNRDRWMDVLVDYTKVPQIYIDPEIRVKGQYGYAYDSRLSEKPYSAFATPDKHSMLFDSINLGRNASDPFVSLPKPGRHEGRNNIGFLDGHVKSRKDELK